MIQERRGGEGKEGDGKWEKIGRSRERRNYNQEVLYEKIKSIFNKRKKKK